MSLNLFAPLVQYGWVRGALLVVLLIYVIWFWYRAGSGFIILERLSRLIGKRGFQTKAFEAQWTESHDVEKFCFIYNVAASTRSDVEKLIGWARDHDVGMQQISAVRRWIDIRSQEVLLQPKKSYMIWELGKFFACLLGMLIVLPAVNFQSALLYTHGTHRFILVSPEAIQPLSVFENWTVRKPTCVAGPAEAAQLSGLSADEANSLCKLLTDSEGPATIRNVVRQQVVAASMVEIPIFIFGIVLGRRLNSAAKAIDLKKYLAGRLPPAPAVQATAGEPPRAKSPRSKRGSKAPPAEGAA